jgi:hypothetical protein
MSEEDGGGRRESENECFILVCICHVCCVVFCFLKNKNKLK